MAECTDRARDRFPDYAEYFDQGMTVYCVEEGEDVTLAQIAQRYNVLPIALEAFNQQATYQEHIAPGTPILVPTANPGGKWVIEFPGRTLKYVDTTSWPGYGLIGQLETAANIIEYRPDEDAYHTDTGSYSRQQLYAEAIQQTVAATLTEYHPDQIKRDLLYTLLADDSSDGYLSIGAKVEDIFFNQMAGLLQGAGAFDDLERMPTRDEIAASLRNSLGEGYTTEDVVSLANDIAYSLLAVHSEDPLFLVQVEALLEFSTNYLLVEQVSAIQRALNTWDPEYEQELLIRLQTQINAMPFTLIGVPVSDIRMSFQSFHRLMTKRHRMMNDLKVLVDQQSELWSALRAQTLTDKQFAENLLGQGVEFLLSVAVEPIDMLLSLRAVINGDASALIGLIPFIPGSVGRVGRILRGSGRFIDDAAGALGRAWEFTNDLVRSIDQDLDTLFRWVMEGGEPILKFNYAGAYDYIPGLASQIGRAGDNVSYFIANTGGIGGTWPHIPINTYNEISGNLIAMVSQDPNRYPELKKLVEELKNASSPEEIKSIIINYLASENMSVDNLRRFPLINSTGELNPNPRNWITNPGVEDIDWRHRTDVTIEDAFQKAFDEMGVSPSSYQPTRIVVYDGSTVRQYTVTNGYVANLGYTLVPDDLGPGARLYEGSELMYGTPDHPVEVYIVEWQGPNGSMSMDFGHITRSGPPVDHIGYRVPGGSAHILLPPGVVPIGRLQSGTVID